METGKVARVKKKAQREGRLIVFVDESGLSTRPTRVRTWAPRGQTPLLQETFNWKSLSIIGGLVLLRFFFQIHSGSIKGPQVVEFLKALKGTIRGKLLVIWDGLPAHRSRLVRNYVESLDGHIVLERLPGYAPELNPVEYLFGHAKQHELANLCLQTIEEVKGYATRRLKAMQRRPRLIQAFWQQADLAL